MVAVPVLVTLTDRVDAKRVYLFGVALHGRGPRAVRPFADGFWSALATRALTGIGWAGTYMTGLKLLADKVDGKLMSRAAPGHAASIGISGALSFACADLLADARRLALGVRRGGVSAAVAWLLVALGGAAPHAPRRSSRAERRRCSISARCSATARRWPMRIAYCIHTLEMNALRGWGVAFLGFVAVDHRRRPEPRSRPTLGVDRARADRHRGERARQRGRDPLRPAHG